MLLALTAERFVRRIDAKRAMSMQPGFVNMTLNLVMAIFTQTTPRVGKNSKRNWKRRPTMTRFEWSGDRYGTIEEIARRIEEHIREYHDCFACPALKYCPLCPGVVCKDVIMEWLNETLDEKGTYHD